MKVFIEQHPNESLRTVHLSKPLTANMYDEYAGMQQAPKKVQKLHRALRRAIEVSDDMTSNRLSRKEIQIGRNLTYSWEECQAAVVRILEKYYGESIEMEVGERNPEWDRRF